MFPMRTYTFVSHLTSGPSLACKTYEQAAQSMHARRAYMRLQYRATRQHDVVLRTECDIAGWQDMTYPMPLNTSFATHSHKNHSTIIGFQPTRDHMSSSGHKVTAQPWAIKGLDGHRFQTISTLRKFNSSLNSVTHTTIQLSLLWM
jgi:hypothetical protein